MTLSIMNELKLFLSEKGYISPWIHPVNADFSLLTKIAPIVSLAKGNLLFHQGEINEYFYIVHRGRLRLFSVDSFGNENCVYIAEEGSMIGEVSAIDKKPNYVSAYTIVDTTLHKIKYKDFLNDVKVHPSISIDVMNTMSMKVRIMNSQIAYRAKDTTSRVSLSLIALCVHYGVRHEKGIRIDIRFTHEELSNLVGLNRVTVSKAYKILFEQNIIIKESGYIIACNIERLKDLCL